MSNLLIATALFGAPTAFGRSVPFYNDAVGWTPEEMDLIVATAQPGDVLEFDGQHQFKIGRKLGCGGTTCIFELLEHPGKAIRVPWRVSKIKSAPYLVTEFINKYVDGYKAIKEHEVPAVQMFDYIPNHYVIVEELNISMSLYRFLRHSQELPVKQRELMTRRLLDFAVKTKDFISFGNFNSTQVAYVNNRGWILIDWTARHQLRHSQLQNQNVFDSVFKTEERDLVIMMGDSDSLQGLWLKELQVKIKNSITRERYGRRFFECQAAMLMLLGS